MSGARASGAARSACPPALVKQAIALLRSMIALRLAYQRAHWNAKGYANHLLFERLYKSLDEDIDAWAELVRQETGSVIPDAGDVRAARASTPAGLRKAEDAIGLKAGALIAAGPLPKACENFLMNLMQNRMRAIYLLKQAGR